MFSFLTGGGTPRDAPAAAPEASTRSSARMSAVSVEGSVSQNPRRLTKRRSKGKMSISPVARAERSVRPSLRNSLVVPEETIFEEAPQSVVAIGGVRLKAGEPAWMREVGKADVFTRGVVTSIESRTECVVTTDGGAQLTKKAAEMVTPTSPEQAWKASTQPPVSNERFAKLLQPYDPMVHPVPLKLTLIIVNN